MKILCINTNGLHNDGITNSVFNYYSHMDRSDMQIDLLQTRETPDNIVCKATDLELNLAFTDYRRKVISYIIRTAKLIRKESYDIVHVHGSSALLSIDLLAAYLGGCKVRIAHSRNTKCNHNNLDRLLRPLFYRLCTERYACGEAAGRWLFGNRSFKVIKNAKDLTLFKFNEEVRNIIRIQKNWSDKLVFGHVGNFNYQKNHEFLILIFSEIVKKYNNAILVLMGIGDDYLKRAKEQVNKLGLQERVFFLGSVNNVNDLYQAMDIMLFPSRFEGFPNVVLEWQISGLPSIVSNKITSECRITELVKFVSIHEGVEPWIKEVDISANRLKKVKRYELSNSTKEKMEQSGFDIVEGAKILKNYYSTLLEFKK